MAGFLQPSMSGGELAPGLQGRVDLVKYATSLKTCRNFITKPTGGAEKRPGTIFRGKVKDSTRKTRLIPFIYSTQVRYLVEMGHNYMRFWVGGALLRDGSSNIVEVATPYSENEISKVRFTQSADVMYLVHPDISPRELRRVSATSFVLQAFNFRRGPFRGFNSDEARIMTTSGVEGNVTVTANSDTFEPEDVGGLLYLEEKELRSIKPWTPGERNVPLNDLRRSDSKVYRAVGVPSTGGGAGTPYYITGSVRPTHENGRAFDGGQDKKSDGVNDYWTGVEWQYVHGGYGILKITGYIDARTVSAIVIERVPDSIKGALPVPGNTWTLSGDGSTVTFPIAGVFSTYSWNFRVTINGAPVQSNPNYPGGGGVGGGGIVPDRPPVQPGTDWELPL